MDGGSIGSARNDSLFIFSGPYTLVPGPFFFTETLRHLSFLTHDLDTSALRHCFLYTQTLIADSRFRNRYAAATAPIIVPATFVTRSLKLESLDGR